MASLALTGTLATYSIEYRHADGTWQRLPEWCAEARNSRQYRLLTPDGRVLAYHNTADACREDIEAIALVSGGGISHTMPCVVQDHDPHTCGSSLDYSPTGHGPWAMVSAHDTLADALAAFRALPSWKDRDPTHYRIEAAQDAVRPNAVQPLPADFRPGYDGEQVEG